jgi:hypothetical protein
MTIESNTKSNKYKIMAYNYTNPTDNGPRERDGLERKKIQTGTI